MTNQIKMQCSTVRGVSHIKAGMPCQDASRVAFNQGAVAMAVADGAGSLKRSDEGSQIAVDAAVEHLLSIDPEMPFIDEYFGQLASAVSLPLVDETINDSMVRAVAIAADAIRADEGYKSMGSTLTAALITEEMVSVITVGDSFGVIALANGGFTLVLPPKMGEYANQTRLLSSDDFEIAASTWRREDVIGVALCSDGMEQASIQSNLAHGPFWRTIFNLQEQGELDLDALFRKVEDGGLTNDDISMAIATL